MCVCVCVRRWGGGSRGGNPEQKVLEKLGKMGSRIHMKMFDLLARALP